MQEISATDSSLILGDPLSMPAEADQDELSSRPDQVASSFQPPLPAAPPPLPPSFAPEMPVQSPEELKARRDEIRAANAQRQQAMEGQREVEEKVIGALQTRSGAAMQGAKDLVAFVKFNADLADYSQKNYGKYAALFAAETDSTAETAAAIKASCETMQQLYGELQQQLASQHLKRAEDSLVTTEETCKRISSQCSAMKTDLLNARTKLQQTAQGLERAWDEANAAQQRGDKRVAGPDLDPWLAGLKYQAASKALETVDANYASSLRRLVQDLREVELKRGEVVKSVLADHAASHQSLLEKGLEGARAVSLLAGASDPHADCAAFLSSAEIRDDDFLARNGDVEPPSEASATLGVWIPDDAVRQCTRCQAGFSLMRRKHHCRRCGHVFCDACSQKTALLPASFGFGRKPQRVCEGCFELLQTAGDAAGQGDVTKTGCDFEVAREGPLIRKGGIGPLKPRHFVCTRAGFLHWFDSKFDSQPLGSLPLRGALLSTVDDDACAIAILADDAPPAGGGAAAFWKSKMSKGPGGRGKQVLRSPIGSIDRDNWITALKEFCTVTGDVAVTPQ